MSLKRLFILIGVIGLSLVLVSGALGAANATQPAVVLHRVENINTKLLDDIGINFPAPPPYDVWKKLISINNGPLSPWIPGFQYTVETSNTIKIVDVITTPKYSILTLTEVADPAALKIINYTVKPPVTPIVPPKGGVLIFVLEESHVYTITKWFHVEPCKWVETSIMEILEFPDGTVDQRIVHVFKTPPDLWIDGDPDVSEVYPGQLASFQLNFGNNGGFENYAYIVNHFPPEAPFAFSNPPPTTIQPGGLAVTWTFPMGIPGGFTSTIDVVVNIAPTLSPSETVTVADEIFNHLGDSVGRTSVMFHVNEPPPYEWWKWVNGIFWTPEISVTAQTSDTIEVVDVVQKLPNEPLVLEEEWDPLHLHLIDIVPQGGAVFTKTGAITWGIPEGPGVVTLTKYFHVEPCMWERTILWERLFQGNYAGALAPPAILRPVLIIKLPPLLWINGVVPNPEVYAGDTAAFTLTYGNLGGYENNVWIRNVFPPEALFVSSVPPETAKAGDGSWAVWAVGDLAQNDEGSIDVNVAIDSTLLPSTTIVITDFIINHMQEPVDIVTLTLHVTEPVSQDDDHDIYIKDNNTDDGSVPSSGSWWLSPDIWVRTDGDCTQLAHQNPTPGAANTVCVRVRNRMTTTVEDIDVDVYYASAGMGLSWPGSFNYIDTFHIASLAGGAEVVESVVWNTPNIAGHFCLLARADAPKDPIGSGPDTVSPTDSVPNNNNIAQKNAYIVDYPEVTECGFYTTTIYTDVVTFDALNSQATSTTVDIEFEGDDFPIATGMLKLELGALWGRWTSLTNFVQVDHTLVATALPAVIEGLELGPHEVAGITMTIVAEIDEWFTIDVTEKVGTTTVGGVQFVRQMVRCIMLPEVFRIHTPPVLNRWISGQIKLPRIE
jgi:hypothetical protein